MEKKMNNKGFSLVELIVVIAIMAVLVGVLAPQFIKYVEKSRQSTDISNLDSIKQVVEAYYADQETVPAKVVISRNASKVFECKDGGGADLSNVLAQGGVKDTKVKGAWSTLKATWDTANNSWEYEVAGSNYYKLSGTGANNSIIPE